MTNVIEIKDLKVRYGRHEALGGLTMSVRKGEIFGFIGPNGAGKSTTIKTLLGLIPSYQGQVRLHGLPPEDKNSRRKVGYLPEDTQYYRFLTPLETLEFYGRMFGLPPGVLRKKSRELLELVGLEDVRKRLLGTFSKGMLQKVGIAQALVGDPETLVLDEPTSGLDPLARLALRKTLSGLRDRGKTIFFSSHELSEVELLSDSIAMVKAGTLVRAGSIREVLGEHRERHLERFFLETMNGEKP